MDPKPQMPKRIWRAESRRPYCNFSRDQSRTLAAVTVTKYRAHAPPPPPPCLTHTHNLLASQDDWIPYIQPNVNSIITDIAHLQPITFKLTRVMCHQDKTDEAWRIAAVCYANKM